MKITIQEDGEYTEDKYTRNTLAYRVAVALFRITKAKNFSPPKTPRKSDWEIVSLDLKQGILIVKRA